MCNCKEEFESKIRDVFIQKEPEASNHKVELTGYTARMNTNDLTEQAFMPAELSADYPLKNGGTKKKKKTHLMFFKYCPFCGAEI